MGDGVTVVVDDVGLFLAVRVVNHSLSMFVRLANRESMMTSWLSSRVLKVRVASLIATCIFCWFVWIISSRRWFIDWIASSKSLGVGLVSFGGIGKGNESTNDDKFGNYL